MKKLVRLIDKRVDILRPITTQRGLVHQELALYKLSTEKVLEHGSIEYLVRKYNVRILRFQRLRSLSKAGHRGDASAFEELANTIGVLQFVRSGRIAITKSKVERLSDMLAKREEQKGTGTGKAVERNK